jgi:hypothetical protein
MEVACWSSACLQLGGLPATCLCLCAAGVLPTCTCSFSSYECLPAPAWSNILPVPTYRLGGFSAWAAFCACFRHSLPACLGLTCIFCLLDYTWVLYSLVPFYLVVGLYTFIFLPCTYIYYLVVFCCITWTAAVCLLYCSPSPVCNGTSSKPVPSCLLYLQGCLGTTLPLTQEPTSLLFFYDSSTP